MKFFFLSSYIALNKWIWKIYHIDIILRPKLCQFVQFEISPSMTHKVFIFSFLKITQLLPATFLCLSQARIWISNVKCHGLFYVQWVLLSWEAIVGLVDVCGIDDHHCLNFLFIKQKLRGMLNASWYDSNKSTRISSCTNFTAI